MNNPLRAFDLTADRWLDADLDGSPPDDTDPDAALFDEGSDDDPAH